MLSQRTQIKRRSSTIVKLQHNFFRPHRQEHMRPPRPIPWSPLSNAHSLAPWTTPMKTAIAWMLQPCIHTLHLSVAISVTNSAALRRCIHARCFHKSKISPLDLAIFFGIGCRALYSPIFYLLHLHCHVQTLFKIFYSLIFIH